MKYNKPTLEEIKLTTASVFLDASQTGPDIPWGDDEKEDIPEIPLPWREEGEDPFAN